MLKLILVIDGCEIALRWLSVDLTDNKATFFQVMAWCRQAVGHYLRHFWHISMASRGHKEFNSLRMDDAYMRQ